MSDRPTNGALYRRIHHSFHRQSFLTLIGAELRWVEKGRASISCRRDGVGGTLLAKMLGTMVPTPLE